MSGMFSELARTTMVMKDAAGALLDRRVSCEFAGNQPRSGGYEVSLARVQ